MVDIPHVTPTPPPPPDYAKLLRNCIDRQLPPPKIEARPALVPLIEQARQLLSQANPDNDACLALYQQIMRVPPAGQ